jgi:hypothetical protein
VLALALACGARAGERDIVGRLQGAGAEVARLDLDGEEDALVVRLRGERATDEALAELCELRALRMLILSDARVTDGGLRAVGGLSGLKVLNLEGAPVTHAGLRELGGCAG